MNHYRADLHIHTVLSPCGDLEMSPANIIETARNKGIDIIGITDHNSTRHCKLTKQLAESAGIFVLMGAEVTSREEVHCLTFFENDEQLNDFQQYLETYLSKTPNNPEKFGYQVVVDEHENILDQVEYLLISGLTQSITQIEAKVHSLGGLFIPAHIDRPSYSITSQLGFIPDNLLIDAIEISANCKPETMTPFLGKHRHKAIIRTSDAHYIEDIGKATTDFELEHRNFEEIKLALQQAMGRKTSIL